MNESSLKSKGIGKGTELLIVLWKGLKVKNLFGNSFITLLYIHFFLRYCFNKISLFCKKK